MVLEELNSFIIGIQQTKNIRYCHLLPGDTLYQIMSQCSSGNLRNKANFLLSVVLLLLIVHCTNGQETEVGTTLCGCQPSQYTITLNLTLSCNDRTISPQTPGVNDTECIVESRGVAAENIPDPFPTFVTDIVIIELDQKFDPIGQLIYNDSYVDGDTITYTSVLADTTRVLNSSTLPRALQIASTGINADGQPLTNTWVILFSNDCSVYPVLQVGQQIGWTVFVSCRFCLDKSDVIHLFIELIHCCFFFV